MLLPVLLIAATFSSCDIINPSEPTPTFVHIDSFSFSNPDPNTTGSGSHKITAVWVYLNNKALGVFDLPCTFPVLMDKKSFLSIAPGVTYGGLKDFQALYPFYMFDSMTIEPAPGETIDLKAKTKYYNGLSFPYIENFDIGNGFERADKNAVEDTSLVRTSATDKVFEGDGSGYIYMDGVHPKTEIVNTTSFPIKTGNAFIELNYKCSVGFLVGLRGTLQDDVTVYKYFHGVNANGNWNKLYIDIEPYMGELQALKYQVLIRAELPEGQSDGYILLDNIKVVTF